MKDNSVKLLQYYPAATMARRDALERILKVILEKAPKNMINTQVRPGTKDIEAWIKINHPGQRNFYEKKSLIQLDPNQQMPKLKIMGFLNNPELEKKIEDANNAAKPIAEEMDEVIDGTNEENDKKRGRRK